MTLLEAFALNKESTAPDSAFRADLPNRCVGRAGWTRQGSGRQDGHLTWASRAFCPSQDAAVARIPPGQLGWHLEPGLAGGTTRGAHDWLHGEAHALAATVVLPLQPGAPLLMSLSLSLPPSKVWERDLLCRHVLQERQLLLCHPGERHWPAAALRGELGLPLIPALHLATVSQTAPWSLSSSFKTAWQRPFPGAGGSVLRDGAMPLPAQVNRADTRPPLQVALGECIELLEANPEGEKLAPGKHSTKGLGRLAPSPGNSTCL